MKIERTKNAVRNVFFGIALKLYQIVIPFLMRTAMIYCMGIEYLGLNSLFTSVLQVLNLMELGVGSAMVYSMYKPIAEDDENRICALTRLYRTYYRIIGLVILIFGMILLPFIPNLIEGDIPNDINIYILYLLNLGATVLSYWLFAYKNCLLNAHQREDLISKVTLITNTVQYLLQFFVLFYLKNYYVFVIVLLFTQTMTNIIIAFVANRLYPNYKPVGKLKKEQIKDINQRIKDLFTSRIGGVVVNSSDTIVISAFLGLTMLAIYQNYFYILNALIGIITIIFASCKAGIGNSLVVESKEKNVKDFNKLTFIIVWISGVATTCLVCLYQPFIEIWVGKELQLEFTAVICLCIYFYVHEINQLLNLYKDSAGIWHKDRFRTLFTALANLVMNLWMVQFWGIYGVLLSTILSTLLVGMPWLLHNLFSEIFERSLLLPYLKKIVIYTIVVFVGCIITYFLSSLIVLTKWKTLLLRGAICLIVPNVFYYFVYRKNEIFLQCYKLLERILKRRANYK